jgi:ERCC4-type nuclease
MYLCVDYREKWFFEMLDACDDTSFKSNVSNRNLPVGDFLFTNSPEMEDCCLIVERKTFSDLWCSIVDGRFRQQKERLSESTTSEKVIFLIEGTIESVPQCNHGALYGALLNITFKHGYKLLFTNSAKETFSLMQCLWKKLNNNEFDVPSQPATFISKKNKIKSNLFKAQLTVIPGVSPKIADAICNSYTSMAQLIKAYDNILEKKNQELLLTNILVDQNRKIGKATSLNIFNALHFKT